MMIRHFVREGEPVSDVARRFGVCRQTVYNHVSRQGPYVKARQRRASKLDPYKDYLKGRLERFNLPATVLYREIKERGYTGRFTILGDYVRSIKQKRAARLTERYETEPGLQAQIDFAECGTLQVDGLRRKFYLFSLVLGYSRMLWGEFVLSMKQPELLRCLKEAFAALGIPREVLTDNMKQVVDRHEVATGTVRFNRAFLDFAEHYGFLPVAAPPYWPRVKGKVERVIDYVKRSFLCGRSFSDLDDLNRQFRGWQDTVANCRLHGTTGRQPVAMYREESKHLRSSDSVPAYDTRPIEVRKAGLDSHIRYQGVFYSVDPVAAGRIVAVRAYGDRVGEVFEVYCGDRLVALHHRRARGSRRVTLPEHASQIKRLCRGRHRQARPRVVEFEQILACPEVQTRSLDLYEGLLGGRP